MDFITLNNGTKAPLVGIGTLTPEVLQGYLNDTPDFDSQP